jgi:hypothetical protein
MLREAKPLAHLEKFRVVAILPGGNMNTHTIDELADLLPDTIQRFQLLFDRFRHDLDGALERADREYSEHMPSKGKVCEAAFRKYLSETLGNRYTVTEGFIFDSTGQQTKQQDTVIFDDQWSIRLTPKDSDEPSIIPVENVYATIEVKKTLNSKELRSAIKNIRSFKSLKRENIGSQYVTPNRRIANLGLPGNLMNPYFSAIFAFTAGRSMNSIITQLKKDVSTISPDEWPDVIVVHNEGVILPFCATCKVSGTYISKIALDGHQPTYILDKLDGAYSLLGFHLLLMQHLHTSILGSLNFHEMYGALAQVARFLSLLDADQ